MKLYLTIFVILLITQLSSSQPPIFSALTNPFISLSTKNFLPIKNFPKSTKFNPQISENWLTQRINHFNPLDNRTFQQYYGINDEFFTPGGPIFIFMFMSPFYSYLADAYLSEGPVHGMAEEFNGTIVVPHHRYFDRSVVFDELTVDNLRFLSINQAIEDLAHLISHLKSHESRRDSGVILVGWDYGASIATWFSQKYPHLVSGIWASGGKLLPSLDQPEVIQIVEQQLRDFGTPGCVEKIENAFRQIDEMINNNQSHTIRRRFNFCFPIPYNRGDLDITYLYELLTVYFYAYSLVFDRTYIETYSCGLFMNAPVEHDWEALGYVLGLMSLPFPICYPNSFEYQMEIVKEATPAASEFAYSRAFLYLECVEYGFFFNSGNGSSIFGSKFPSEFYSYACEEIFG